MEGGKDCYPPFFKSLFLMRATLYYIVLICVSVLMFLSCRPGSSGTDSGQEDGLRVRALPPEWDGTKHGGITYQLLVYSFADSDGDGIGDFRGIIDKLDYLDSLGVSAIWLSPVHPAMCQSGVRDNG